MYELINRLEQQAVEIAELKKKLEEAKLMEEVQRSNAVANLKTINQLRDQLKDMAAVILEQLDTIETLRQTIAALDKELFPA